MAARSMIYPGAVMSDQTGEIIHYIACHRKGRTLLASVHIVTFGITVHAWGRQCNKSPDVFMPLNVIDNLVYTPIRPFTDNEWETLPSQQITVASSRKSNDLDFVVTDATVSTNITEVRSDLDHNTANLHIDNTFHDQTTNIFVISIQKGVSDATKALPEFKLTMLIRQTAVMGRVFTPRMKLKQCQSFSLLIWLEVHFLWTRRWTAILCHYCWSNHTWSAGSFLATRTREIQDVCQQRSVQGNSDAKWDTSSH